MTSSTVRPTRPDAKPEQRPRTATSEFEATWRNPDRTFVDYFSAIWTRKVWIAAFTGVLGLVVTLYTLTQPNVYQSTASLLVIGNRGGANAAEIAANMLRVGNTGPSQVLAALEVVNSTEVAARVVDAVTPEEITQPYQPERAGEEERAKMGLFDTVTDWMHQLQASWFSAGQTPESIRPAVATEVFRRSFSAWADERAQLIKIAYRASSRAQAQKVLGEVVKVAVERYREVVSPQQSREFVENTTKAAQGEFDLVKAEYDSFLAKNGRLRFTEEIAEQQKLVASTKATLESKKRDRESTSLRLKEFRAKLEPMDPRRKRVIMVSERNETARGEILKLIFQAEAKRIEWEKANNTEKNEYKVCVAQLEYYRAELDKLDRPREVTQIDDNPDYVALDAQVRTLEIQEVSLDRDIPGLEADFAMLQRQVQSLFTLQEQADQLLTRYRAASDKLKSIRDVAANYQIETELKNLGLSSLQVVDSPTLPVEKLGPKRGRLILAGVAAALLLSFTVVMILVRLTRTFLRTSEVTVSLGRSDVVGMPWLERGNVRRFRLARKKGWD